MLAMTPSWPKRGMPAAVTVSICSMRKRTHNERAYLGWQPNLVAIGRGYARSLVERLTTGGLLIHPDLFAQTDFHLFCLH